MEIFNKILHSYAMYCRKEMVKILKCYLIPKRVMAICLRVQFFWPTLYNELSSIILMSDKCFLIFFDEQLLDVVTYNYALVVTYC